MEHTPNASNLGTFRELPAALLAQMPESVAVCTPDARCLYVNPSTERMFARTRDELVGRILWEVFPEATGTPFRQAFERVAATGEPASCLHHHAPLNRTFDYRLYRADGNVWVIARDVTEEAARAVEYQALFASIDYGFCVLQLIFDADDRPLDYRFLKANPAFAEHTGLQNAVGRTARELVPDLDESWFRLYGNVALTGEPARFENHAPAMGRWFEVEATRFGDPALRQVSLVFRNITARKAAEEGRARALARVTEVLESMGDSFFSLDKDWRVQLVNSEQERTSQIPRAQSIGRIFWELWPATAAPDSLYWKEYHRCRDERVAVRFVEYFAPLDIWTDVRAYPTPEGGIAVFFRDVSDEKRAEAAARTQAEFEQQLVGIVSHDLRNPLSAIQLVVDSLLRWEGIDSRTTKGLLRVNASASRATRLVRDLLDFTKARLGGGIVLQRQSVDLHGLARQALEDVQSAFPDRELRVEHDGDTRGEWDVDRLTQVIVNLTTNALTYSPADSVVKVRSWGEGDHVNLSIHNRGTPIPPELLAQLFEPLRRGGAVGANSGSIGLGLFIVKHLVTAHGGTVSVTSLPDEGTTFTVRLPRARVRPASDG